MPAKKSEETENVQTENKKNDEALKMKNVRFYSKFMKTPQDAQRSFNNGRFSGTDINPMFRIKILTEVFGPSGFGWWTQNVQYKFVEADVTSKSKDGGMTKETSVFCELELIVKDPETGEVSQPIYGIGGNTFIVQDKYGALRSSDEAMKMAYTDALSIACKSLGIGHDIWYSNDRTKYTSNNDAEPAPVKAEPKPEPKPAHTPESAELIKQIEAKLQEVRTKMPNPEDRKKFAREVIVPTLGTQSWKTCTDIEKLTALRDKLSA